MTNLCVTGMLHQARARFVAANVETGLFARRLVVAPAAAGVGALTARVARVEHAAVLFGTRVRHQRALVSAEINALLGRAAPAAAGVLARFAALAGVARARGGARKRRRGARRLAPVVARRRVGAPRTAVLVVAVEVVQTRVAVLVVLARARQFQQTRLRRVARLDTLLTRSLKLQE